MAGDGSTRQHHHGGREEEGGRRDGGGSPSRHPPAEVGDDLDHGRSSFNQRERRTESAEGQRTCSQEYVLGDGRAVDLVDT